MHSNSAVCTPTRYGLLTGRYAWRAGLERGVLFGYDAALIEPGRLTLPALLKRWGYATAAFGKWHLGLEWAHRPAGALRTWTSRSAWAVAPPTWGSIRSTASRPLT